MLSGNAVASFCATATRPRAHISFEKETNVKTTKEQQKKKTKELKAKSTKICAIQE
jgi:hypothetical protein